MDVITKHIDVWTSAQMTKSTAGRGTNGKQTAYGIKKLRELILELAVRGLLVPQDPNDEPASVLLEKIAEEKAWLVKEGKIKKQMPLSEISEDEKLFELSFGWTWIRLGSCGIGNTGKTPSTGNPKFFGGTVQFLGPGQISPEGEISESDKTLTEEGCGYSTIANAGDILMVCIGGSIGKSAIAKSMVAFNQQINCMSPLLVNSKFLNLAMNAPHFQMAILEAATGSATPIINRSKWEELLIPLPPQAEQHRIVAKVDELMALCDQLEQQQTDSNAAHQTLVEMLLATLTHSTNQTEFVAAWQRIAEHFDTLFTTEHSIDQLKQTILQLAVMGKLVPQDPNDEPASVLLEKISEEKARLVKEGKIKKQSPLSNIADKEIPFSLPVTWSWQRLGILAELINGDRGKNYPNSSEYVESGIAFINTGHIDPDGTLSTARMNFITREKYNSLGSGKIESGDLVYCLRGATFGKTAMVTGFDEGAIASSLVIIRPTKHINLRYFYIFLISPFGQSLVRRFDNGSAQPNLSANNVKLYVTPIPPLAEQHRIVAKVDELMTLCDTLKARIKLAQTTQIHLADTIVEQAVA